MFIVTELCVATSSIKIIAVLYNVLDAISTMNTTANQHGKLNTDRKTYETILSTETRAEVYSRTHSWIGDYKVLEFCYVISEFNKETPKETVQKVE